ncbi:uncharacterized protein NPIL_180941 [Nephila pilipes]|uniref:Uncharacterized protein n=1 Tax=Nephila pilipes TaxID=299642 RepID=A0A8X6N3I8_NEPPI|nr:uncharacterized protein NPIL_180941 [Nephila pilipes]
MSSRHQREDLSSLPHLENPTSKKDEEMYFPKARTFHQKGEPSNVMDVELVDTYNPNVIAAQDLKKEEKLSVNSVNLFTFESQTSPLSLIVFKICGVEATNISLPLADGTQNNVAALTTVVNLTIEGNGVTTESIVLLEAKGNETLLGTDILKSAGIVLNVLNDTWHFCENPQIQCPFYEVPSKIENSISISKKIIAEISNSVKVLETSTSLNLRSDVS